MIGRRIFQTFVLCLATILFSVPLVRGEDAIQEIDNSKYQAQGQINSNAVYIRSGPSENDYPTLKLDRGTNVTVVGLRGDWLKIAPPDGSYCYVAKAYVEKRDDGTVGRVTNPLNVRVGSTLNAMKTKVASKLDNGADVKILGEQDEYFKIAPPPDVYLYVNKQFVDLVKAINVTDAAKPQPTDTSTPAATPANPTQDNSSQATGTTPPTTPGNPTASNTMTTSTPVAAGTDQTTTPTPTPPADQTTPTPAVAENPSTQPSADNTAVAAAPATQPTDAQADAESQFDQLEKTFIDNDKKPLDQQPLTDLQSGYEKLAQSTVLPESLRRMCDYRLKVVKQRVTDQKEYLAVKKSQEEMKQKQVALQAEREELENRIKTSGIKYFTALGTLRVSSLQQGAGGTLYRLTDPNSGRTVIYIRSEDPKLGALMGQFVGVQGNVQDEQALNLKSIAPTSFEVVDQSKVNVSIAAQIIPPSMMPTGGTASVGGAE